MYIDLFFISIFLQIFVKVVSLESILLFQKLSTMSVKRFGDSEVLFVFFLNPPEMKCIMYVQKNN